MDFISFTDYIKLPKNGFLITKLKEEDMKAVSLNKDIISAIKVCNTFIEIYTLLDSHSSVNSIIVDTKKLFENELLDFCDILSNLNHDLPNFKYSKIENKYESSCYFSFFYKSNKGFNYEDLRSNLKIDQLILEIASKLFMQFIEKKIQIQEELALKIKNKLFEVKTMCNDSCTREGELKLSH